MKKMLFILVLLVIIVFVSGCTQTQDNVGSLKDQAISKCKSLCEEKLSADTDLSNGPCLSDNNPDWNVLDWVCDVAHDPREAVDNLAENQCQDFRNGRSNHFVEVDPNCDFIKAV
jgi:hypothetical protein